MESQIDSLDEIKRIRLLMERSTIYNSLSGLSGVAAGIIGIIVYAVVYGIAGPLLKNEDRITTTADVRSCLIEIFFISSMSCLLLAFIAVLFFNSRKARKQQIPFFEPAMQKMFVNLFIPLVTGGIYCFALAGEHEYLLIAPSMLIFYGLAMLQASRYTIAEIRYLGFAELAAGLTALFFKEYGMWFWLAGFGFINIIYGAYIYIRYER